MGCTCLECSKYLPWVNAYEHFLSYLLGKAGVAAKRCRDMDGNAGPREEQSGPTFILPSIVTTSPDLPSSDEAQGSSLTTLWEDARSCS